MAAEGAPPGRPVALAWCAFQPRTRALAQELGGNAEFLSGGGGMARASLPLRYLRSAVGTWRRLTRARPRLVVAISPPFLCPLVAWAWCRTHRARLVVDCHTDAFHGPRWGWARPISRWLARRADLVTLHTERHRAEAAGWGARAILLPDDVPGPDQAAELPPSERPVVVVAGSLDDNEPVAAAVEAARLLPEVEFRLTGDQQRVPAGVREVAPTNVVFTGWLSYPMFLGELRTADAVAAFSLDPHIMNRAAFEAVGLRRALVLSDLAGLRDRFGDAAVFCANQPEAMAAAVREALARRAALEYRSTRLEEKLQLHRREAIELMGSLLRDRRTGAPHKRMLMVSQHPMDNPTLRRNVNYLLDEGWELDVFCTAEPDSQREWTRPGLTLRPVRPLRPTGGRGISSHRRSSPRWYPVEYLAFFFRAWPRVTWLSLRRHYDCAQVDNLPDFLIYVSLAARLRGARVVFFMYEEMPTMTRSLLQTSPSHPMVRIASWLEWRATSWADSVVVVTEQTRRRLLGRGVDPAKLIVVPNTQPSGRPPATLPATESPGPSLITHGSLLKRYGVHVAIRAMVHLKQRLPGITLRILGEGDYRPTLEEQVAELGLEDTVAFTGFLPWEVAMAQVRAATIGVVPVIADGYGELLLPNKLFDYVAMGVPVVCSRLPVIEEYFPAGSVAYFEAGDPAGLAAQVERLLLDPGLRTRQAQAAREAAQAVSWERVSGNYLAALQPAAN